MNIREMRGTDLVQVAVLAEQLGYPLTLKDLEVRFPKVLQRANDKLLVAVDTEERICGWIHLQIQEDLLSERKGEVRAFVVDSALRSMGIGRALLKMGEQWVREQGAKLVFLRTNIAREAAHRFYRREDFKLTKTSHMFVKEI